MGQDSEMMRLQLLGNPDLMRQIQEVVSLSLGHYEAEPDYPLCTQTQPEIAAAAQSNPTRFAELLRQTRERQYQAELEQQREIMRLNANPFDVEAQRRIEESIRQQAVIENMEHALEYVPESFGRVTML
jgi:DNA damage-inducible protein 1